jgi:hypothetical protein
VKLLESSHLEDQEGDGEITLRGLGEVDFEDGRLELAQDHAQWQALALVVLNLLSLLP